MVPGGVDEMSKPQRSRWVNRFSTSGVEVKAFCFNMVLGFRRMLGFRRGVAPWFAMGPPVVSTLCPRARTSEGKTERQNPRGRSE